MQESGAGWRNSSALSPRHSLGFRQAVKEPFATEVKVAVDSDGRCAKGIAEGIDREHGTVAAVPQYHSRSVATGYIDPVRGPQRGGKDEIPDPLQAQRLA